MRIAKLTAVSTCQSPHDGGSHHATIACRVMDPGGPCSGGNITLPWWGARALGTHQKWHRDHLSRLNSGIQQVAFKPLPGWLRIYNLIVKPQAGKVCRNLEQYKDEIMK